MSASGRLGRALGVVAALAAATGCGGDGGTGAGAPGGGGDPGAGGGSASTGATGGAGGEGAIPSAGDVLAASTYDCRAADAPLEPGPRPHDLACIADPACTGRFVMAHRMGNPFGPENSLSVLRASILLGADVVETDIRRTADGRVVLIHDEDVDRTLEGTGDVASLTLAEIQAMTMRIGSSDPAGDFACDRAPSLEEAMAVAAGHVIVELETKDVAAATLAAAWLRDEGLTAWAYVQCDASECATVRAEVPDAPIAFRLESLDEVPLIAALDPPPIFVEIDDAASLRSDPALRAALDAGGTKLFTNVFTTADVQAALGDLTGYDAALDRGYAMIQVELIHLALIGMGRLAPP